MSNSPFEVELIAPVSRGGSNDLSNLALACPCCNSHKGVATAGWDDATAAEVNFFNPRESRWEEHFLLDIDTGMIDGLTPTGRVTVNGLGMNDARPLSARQLWIATRLYP